MRVPPDPVTAPHAAMRRRGLWILVALGALLVVLVLAEAASGFYTNFLWYHAAGAGAVWRSLTTTKLLLGTVFVLVAFVACFVNLYLVELVAPRATMFMASDAEFVRRYQATIGPHTVLVRTVVSVVFGLLLGVGASSQWQHWLLFEHAVAFGRSDPLFNLDDSFFVFRLPFLSFLVGWLLVMLLVVLALSMIGHFLNGAIRAHGSPRIEPRALAHLSLILGAMALVRAWGYYFVDRYRLDLSLNGVVQGASYTDVHVRLPAITLLAVVSLAAFVMLVFNAYQRSTVLPAVAVGLWVLLAFVLEVLYPAVLQGFKVAPAQQKLERAAISHNIAATQFAMGIGPTVVDQFPANQDLNKGVLSRYSSTLADAQVWDPASTQSSFAALQSQSAYFHLSTVSLDRYRLGGRVTPVIVAVHTLNESRLSSLSWTAAHLEYTHGYGAVLAPANSAQRNGNPVFALGGVPVTARDGAPALRQPEIYFAPQASGYSIVDTTEPELNAAPGTPDAPAPTHYHGTGGVPIGGLAARLAYAIQLKDFNLLTSGAITAHSRLITMPDVRQRVERAYPFLRIDQHPYPVINHGHVDWVVDGYTTSSTFPDAEAAPTGELPAGSPLNGGFNYVRDAVKIVVNAYSGQMHAYVIDPHDPVIRAWERVFPGLFSPMSAMDATLRLHLRYPADLLAVQALMYSRYHVSNPNTFYLGTGAWQPAAIVGTAGTSGQLSAVQPPATNSAGIEQPIYELVQLPGDRSPSLEAVEALVPFSTDSSSETLSALLFASSAPQHYGRLEALVTPRSGVPGPAMASAAILRSPAVSRTMAHLSRGGSTVSFGAVQSIPIADSLVYVDPLYASSSSGGFPVLRDVVVVYGKKIAVDPTLSSAFDAAFGIGPRVKPRAGSSSSADASVRALLRGASADYAAAKKALANGDLGTYQRDFASAAAAVARAEHLLGGRRGAARTSVTTPAAHAQTRATPTATSTAAQKGIHRQKSVAPHRSARSERSGIVEEPTAPVTGMPRGATSGRAATSRRAVRSSLRSTTTAAPTAPLPAEGSALGLRPATSR